MAASKLSNEDLSTGKISVESEKKVIGLKQSLKAISQDRAMRVYIAKDANITLTAPIVELCEKKGIEIRYADTSRQLGLLNGISVCASVVCILK
ncbi:MAG: ribosomal L7Ae/L30e/S12e/Gadd45 family protein [Clostridia bacterium]|mgnify:FL=1|jgi:large subunit ribosomal protein L7A|nr:ribosomal L7Ae/L30e/S12e/Gadd45 family protein [Clostridia bacterium]NLV34329.1 50S ribosomal protein L7ae-like protein [Clostridiaceae bacterium]HPB17765.1 ribosomal L7Ae/L30e/S12e/Gadd45 family protein [Clostridia bacterium]